MQKLQINMQVTQSFLLRNKKKLAKCIIADRIAYELAIAICILECER